MSLWWSCMLVGTGGFLGAIARFLLSRGVHQAVDTPFPLGTFLVNMSGSFLLGALGVVVSQRMAPESEAMRLGLGIGFLGAYTTFSTLELETHALFEDGSWLLAATNMAASLFVGLLALRFGIVIARSWLG